MLYLHLVSDLSLHLFSVISSLNTVILNQANTRIKFHTQTPNRATSALFQEGQVGEDA